MIRWLFYIYSGEYINTLMISDTDISPAGWYIRNQVPTVRGYMPLSLDSFDPGKELLVICNGTLGWRV